ncbi:MAG: SET domain-containing protein [Cyanobacteria bacterium M_surface_10_m2_119]|nr:SET domain-containing protein [Cyanobacteria bacterium M_surface_10_m2_119]
MLIGRHPSAMTADRHPPQVSVRPCEFGLGLFAVRPFAEGEEILEFSGPELSFEAMLAKGELEANTLQIDDSLYLDLGAPGVYANHSCLPNAGVRNDRQLVALRSIRAGEEIRYDYSTTMWENHWTMPCRCGQVNCRRVVADFPTLPSQLQRRYLHLQVVQRFIVERLRQQVRPR